MFAAMAVQAEGGLRIGVKFFEPETGILKYELWNESNETATAWVLSLVRDQQGRGGAVLQFADFYMAVDEVMGSSSYPNEIGPIAPGAVRSGEWRVPIRGGEDLGPMSLKLVAVVYEDTSYQGDPDTAETVFAGRRARLGEIAGLLDQLKVSQRPDLGGLLSGLAIQTETLRGQAESTASEAFGESAAVAGARSAARLELTEYLEWLVNMERTGRLSQELLDELTDGLETEYEIGMRQVPHAN